MKVTYLAFTAFFLLIGITLFPQRAEAQPTLVGEWRTLPYLMPINPIHVGLAHTGKVLIAAGSENDSTTKQNRAAVWDPAAGSIVVQYIPWDLFCNGMSFLSDGRLFLTGGTLRYNTFLGLRTTTIFDPVAEKFIQVQDMAHGRWYPTNTALSDGRTVTFSGITDYNHGTINNAVEIYDVSSGWSPEYRAPWTPPLYPWLHLLPNGKLFYSGSTSRARLFDPATKTWGSPLPSTKYERNRKYGSSVLLPLWPEDAYRPRVLIMGGNDPATATVEMIDLSETTPRWRFVASMSAPRIQMNAVLLPTGKVLALGGSARNEDASTASLAADLFDPTTEQWSPAGVGAYPRLYHSVALLLPDATVWVAGSNPSEGVYEPRMEIYSPPYLFTTGASGQVIPAPRPAITAVSAQKIGYAASFTVQTPDSADIASVVLIRPGASTHGFDMEQRLVGLTFAVQAGSLAVTSPPDPNIASPGYYMLFLLNRNGVPSVATFVQLSQTPQNQPPKGMITSPATDVTIQTGESIGFGGSGTDADGVVSNYSWVFPGGAPAVSNLSTPGPVVFSEPGTYIVSLTVTDNAGENDPSPPRRTVTVQGSALDPPDLVEIAVSDPPSSALLGSVFSVTDTVRNVGPKSADGSITRYYLSLDTTKDTSDRLLTGNRPVPSLGPGEESAGTVKVTIPTNVPLDTYFLLACADDTKVVVEGDESNNCLSSQTTVQVTAPDLVETEVSDPPAGVALGGSFSVTDSVLNQGSGTAGASTTRYWLSLDTIKSLEKPRDVLLTGTRSVPSLNPGDTSTGTVTVTVPTSTATGTYYLLSCADDLRRVVESNEANNCRASATQVTVGQTAPSS